MCVQEKNLVHITLIHARLPESNGESLLQVNSCWGKRHETVNQTNNLKRFCTHQGPGSGMFWEDYGSYPSDYPRSSSLSKNTACWSACTITHAIMGNMWWVKDLCTDAGLWSHSDWGNSEMAPVTSVTMAGFNLFRNDNIWFSRENFHYPVISWRDNTAGHKKSSMFLKCINDNFLLQVETMRRGGLLVLISPTRRDLLGCEDQRQPWLQW